MNKELEDAKEILEIMTKNLKEYGIYHTVTDNEQQAISTVLQALESYQIKELQFLNNKLDNISATELQTILQPYYIQQESLKHKDEIINELKNVLENSIPKEVVEKEIKKLKEMKVNGEVFTTSVNFAVKILEGILEGK